MKKMWILVLIGVLCGAVNGFFGGGAGLLLVPLLGLYGLDIKHSHATSVAITLPMSVVSLCVYLFCGGIQTEHIWLYLIGGSIGGVIGAFLLKKAPPKFIKILFSLFMIFSAVRMWFM